jgi:ferredoxin
MPYVVTDNCVACRFTDCVEVCPVDCFYLDDEKQMVLIHPDECIDCGACEPTCPVQAIFSTFDLPAEKKHWEDIALPRIKEANLPVITETREALPGAEERKKSLGF